MPMPHHTEEFNPFTSETRQEVERLRKTLREFRSACVEMRLKSDHCIADSLEVLRRANHILSKQEVLDNVPSILKGTRK
jgi:hypothetical protein